MDFLWTVYLPKLVHFTMQPPIMVKYTQKLCKQQNNGVHKEKD
jgi:hypothetical protein